MMVIEPTSPVEVIFSRPLSSLTHTLTLNYMATEAPELRLNRNDARDYFFPAIWLKLLSESHTDVGGEVVG
jgi:hypothetical protein